jgi:16S rRNA (uracil1498-N3)-methyltransferase
VGFPGGFERKFGVAVGVECIIESAVITIRAERVVSDRFYCAQPPTDDKFVLRGEEAKHLVNVCRFALGDRAQIFDGRGARYETEVLAIRKEEVELGVISGPTFQQRPQCELAVASAVPKGERFDWLVEKATELGVDRLIPLLCERSVVNPGASKLERLRRNVIEASKQCARDRLMAIEPPMRFDQILQLASESTARLLAHPGGFPFLRWPRARSVVLAVGPEGGFSSREVDEARASGWNIVSLGSYRLRVETAAIAASAVILSQSERSEE